ncbi:uncharacterized protein ACRADG_005443 [Cochliomyia hominivorax]
MKLYASCQYKCGDNKQINCNYNCRLGHDNMATGSGDYPDNTTTTNSPSPSSLYSSCPQLNQYRSLPRNTFSAIRRPIPTNNCRLQHLYQQQHQQQETQQHSGHYQVKTNSEQELRRSALLKSTTASNPRHNNRNIILCGKCAV